jgi:hypothetical protein
MDNLQDYELVKDRIDFFYKKYPDGRIITEMIRADKFEAIFKASIYRDYRDLKDNTPIATGFAQEFQDREDPFNNACWYEISETSAIGRALRNAAIGREPTREEMHKPLIMHPFKVKAEKKKAVQTIKAPLVSGPKVASDFQFKKQKPDLESNSIQSYVIPEGRYQGQKLKDLDIMENGKNILEGYTDFLRNTPKKRKWVYEFINVSEQFQRLNS